MAEGRVKGSIVAEVVKFLRSRKEQARPLLPESLRPYLETRVLSTSWHPEEDYLGLMRVVVQIYPRPVGEDAEIDLWELVARRTNPAYFEGPYKSLIQQGHPERSLASFDRLWSLRHDTGEITVEPLGAGRARIVLRDYALVAEEACRLTQGTMWGVLEYSGARGIELVHDRCRARGDDACEWRVAWSLVD